MNIGNSPISPGIYTRFGVFCASHHIPHCLRTEESGMNTENSYPLFGLDTGVEILCFNTDFHITKAVRNLVSTQNSSHTLGSFLCSCEISYYVWWCGVWIEHRECGGELEAMKGYLMGPSIQMMRSLIDTPSSYMKPNYHLNHMSTGRTDTEQHAKICKVSQFHRKNRPAQHLY